MRGEVLRGRPSQDVLVNFVLRVIYSDAFHEVFLEGSILAQDERWRRATHTKSNGIHQAFAALVVRGRTGESNA